MRKILIIDDSDLVRELYAYVFTDLGYKVETAKNGSDGLEKAPVFKPDCMLIDIMMPEMTCDEFARKLQESADPRLRNIPFIVMTGGNNTNTSLEYAFQGNASFKALLSKMASPDSVARMVQDILEPRE